MTGRKLIAALIAAMFAVGAVPGFAADQTRDRERRHATEQVAYVVFRDSAAYPPP